MTINIVSESTSETNQSKVNFKQLFTVSYMSIIFVYIYPAAQMTKVNSKPSSLILFIFSLRY